MIKLTDIISESVDNLRTYVGDRDIGTDQEMTSVDKDIQEFGDTIEQKLLARAKRQDTENGEKITTRREAAIKNVKSMIMNLLAKGGWKKTVESPK